MNNNMRWLVWVFFSHFGLFFSSLHAQLPGDPSTITLTLQVELQSDGSQGDGSQGSVVENDFGLYYNFENGPQYLGDVSWIGDYITTPIQEARIKVGKAYTVTASGAATILTAKAIFSVPEGYTLLINDAPAEVAEWFLYGSGGGGAFTLRVRQDTQLAFGESTEIHPERPYWSVGLGTLADGEPAGVLSLRQDTMSAAMFSPNSLIYDNGNELVSKIYVSGTLRQIFVSEGLVDITTPASNQLAIKLYPRWQITTQNGNGTWATTGSPLFEYLLDTAGSSPTTILRITRTNRLGSPEKIDWAKREKLGNNFHTTAWTQTQYPTVGNKQTLQVVTGQDSSIHVQNGAGVDELVTGKDYENIDQLVELERGQGFLNPDIVNYSYSASGASGDDDQLGGVELVTTGQWEYKQYGTTAVNRGELTKIQKPFRDQSNPGSLSTAGLVTSYTYGYNTFAGYGMQVSQRVQTARETKHDNTQRVEYETRVYTSRSASVSQLGTSIDLLEVAKNEEIDGTSSAVLSTKLTTIRPSAPFGYRNRVYSIERSDGTMTAFAYYRANFDSNNRSMSATTSGWDWVEVEIEGTKNSGPNTFALSSIEGFALPTDFKVVAGASIKTERSRSYIGSIYLITKYIYTTAGWQLLQRDYIENLAGLQQYPAYISRDHGNTGASYLFAEWFYAGGQTTQQIDERGISTAFVYDLNGRLIRSALASSPYVVGVGELYTHYIYNGPGALIETATSASAGYNSNNPGDDDFVLKTTYDYAGRITSRTERVAVGASTHIPVTTSYDYTQHPTIPTITYPDQSTSIPVYHLDGRLARVTGTAKIPVYYHYEYIGGSLNQWQAHSYFNTPASALNAIGWTQTKSDYLGRITVITNPNQDGSTTEERLTYGVGGCSCATRVKKREYWSGTSLLLAPELYEYDNMGRVLRSGSDLNENGSLDNNSVDRISEHDYEAVYDNGAWWAEHRTYIYTFYDTADSTSSSTRTQMAKTHIRLTGLTATLKGEVKEYDVNDNLTRTEQTINRATKFAKTETWVPGSTTTAYMQGYNGMRTAERSATGVETDYTYDGMGRLHKTHGRDNVEQEYFYYEGTTKIKEVENYILGWTKLSSNWWQRYEYDIMGRVTMEQKNDVGIARTKRYSYTPRGELYRQWGDAENPAEYAYTTCGERSTMTTWRDSGVSWNSSSWPNPSYLAADVDVTKWFYHAQTRQMESKEDDVENATEYTYNKRGQVTKRVRVHIYSGPNIETDYAYEEASGYRTGDLEMITYNDGTPTVQYNRWEAWSTLKSRTGAPLGVWDATGYRSFSYRYEDDMQLKESFLIGEFYGSNDLGGRLEYYDYETAGVVGRLKGIEMGGAMPGNTWDRDGVYGVNFTYDSATGRVNTISTQGTFGAQTWTYGYQGGSNHVASVSSGSFVRSTYWESWRESKGQVKTTWSGVEKATFDYDNDWFNRHVRERTSGAIKDSLGLSLTYGLAQLWDYDSRSQLAYSDGFKMDATHNEDTGQRLNGLSTDWTFDTMGNRTSHTTTGSSAVTWTTNSLNQVTGMGGTSLSYDEDGNTTDDGTYLYTYDAENRVKTTNAKDGSSFSSFVYDYMGRRVRKTVLDGSMATIEDTKYIYVGWQLVAEVEAASPLTVKRQFAWGLDATENFGVAGGVGGLLAVRESNGDKVYPLYDARNHVRGYLDTSGNVVAAMEYNAFGEIIASGGSYLSKVRFGYGTLYRDTQTSLLYHHHRVYSPKLGRFLNRDPIGEQGGLNLYAYVQNDPVNGWDMLGHCEQFYPQAGHVASLVGGCVEFVPYESGSGSDSSGSNRRNGDGNSAKGGGRYDAVIDSWVRLDGTSYRTSVSVGPEETLSYQAIAAGAWLPWDNLIHFFAPNSAAPADMPGNGIIGGADKGQPNYLDTAARGKILNTALGNVKGRLPDLIGTVTGSPKVTLMTNTIYRNGKALYPGATYVKNGQIIVDLTINGNTSVGFVESIIVHEFTHAVQRLNGTPVSEYDAYHAQYEYERQYHDSVLPIFGAYLDSSGNFMSQGAFESAHVGRTGNNPNQTVTVTNPYIVR